MSNLRIISDNAMSRASALTASTTAGTLAASNMLTDIKGQVWRATGTTATLIASWAAGETIACVALPYCNLTPAATMRVRAYSDAGVTLLYDSGALPASPAAAIKLQGWGAGASGVNAYAFGGGACARLWFLAVAGVKQLTVDLADVGNAAGYVEAARIVAGNYWSPTFNADYGAPLSVQDSSQHQRNDAGDLLTVIGTRSRKVSLNLSYLSASDRTALIGIVRGNGMANPLFLSLFPGSSDLELERDYQMYGKLSSISALTIQLFNAYSSPIEIEEV